MPAERQLAHVERLERSLRAAYRQAWPQREIVALLRELLRQEVNPERHPLLRVQLAEALLSLERPSRLQAWQAASLARSVSREPQQVQPCAESPASLPAQVQSIRRLPVKSPVTGNAAAGPEGQLGDVSWLLARAEAAQGLAHTLLGHYTLARRCYERAYQLDAGDPAVNHNLGHLLACVFSEEQRALHHLELAWRELPNELEVAASFAHTLNRVGQIDRARAVLTRAGVTSAQASQWFHSWASPKPG